VIFFLFIFLSVCYIIYYHWTFHIQQIHS